MGALIGQKRSRRRLLAGISITGVLGLLGYWMLAPRERAAQSTASPRASIASTAQVADVSPVPVISAPAAEPGGGEPPLPSVVAESDQPAQVQCPEARPREGGRCQMPAQAAARCGYDAPPDTVTCLCEGSAPGAVTTWHCRVDQPGDEAAVDLCPMMRPRARADCPTRGQTCFFGEGAGAEVCVCDAEDSARGWTCMDRLAWNTTTE